MNSKSKCFGFFLFTLIALFATLFNQSTTVHSQTALVTIEILPIDDVIYKISDELNFENWNFGLSVKSLGSATEIDRLEIRYYSGQNQVHLIEYSGNHISEFLRTQKNREVTFHNFHHMLPVAFATDSLTIDIFSKSKRLAQKSAKLTRYKQHNHYRLPIRGTWFISSGHDFGVEHRRHLSRGHFAWDFVRVDQNGHVGNGGRLEDNFSYGQPVLAAASGVVVDLHEGETDNVPGTLEHGQKANYVEINHGNGEISRAVHLKNGSIKVSKGDSVATGQVIGLVGNSGNSETPHLHFGFHRNSSDGRGGMKQSPLPVLFSKYRVSWNQGIDILVENGRPRRGQFVRPD